MQQIQELVSTQGLRYRRDHCRVVDVLTGRDIGQQQVVAHEVGQHRRVRSIETKMRRKVGDDLDAEFGVIAGATLSDVVQKRAHQQQVRPTDPAGVLRRGDCGLDQVPIDGVTVHGVALRGRPDDLPARNQPADEIGLIQGLPHLHASPPSTEQTDQILPRRPRPRYRQRCGLGSQPVDGVLRHLQPGLGRRCCGPQDQHRITIRPGIGGQHSLAVLHHHAFGQWCPGACAPDLAQPRNGRARDLPAHPAPGHRTDKTDRASGRADCAQEFVLVGVVKHRGDSWLFLLSQPVGGPAGGHVQGVAGIEQREPGRSQRALRRADDPAGGQRPHDRQIAQPAVTLLEVRLQQMGQFAVLCGAVLNSGP